MAELRADAARLAGSGRLLQSDALMESVMAGARALEEALAGAAAAGAVAVRRCCCCCCCAHARSGGVTERLDDGRFCAVSETRV